MFNKIKIILKDKAIRGKIIFVLAVLVLFRVGSSIPIPGVDHDKLSSFLSNNQFFGLLDIFSGGGLSNLSILMLGVAPYITASIIMQLFTMVFPKLKEMYQEDGEAGRQKFNQYSRLMAVPLGFLQGFGLITMLQGQGILGQISFLDKFTNISIMIAGTMVLLWLGELISEKGIGNGISLIIFGGIVANLPSTIQRTLFTFDASQIPMYVLFLAIAVLIIGGVVVISEAERIVPVSYAKQVGDQEFMGALLRISFEGQPSRSYSDNFCHIYFTFPQMIVNLLAGLNSERFPLSGYILTLS